MPSVVVIFDSLLRLATSSLLLLAVATAAVLLVRQPVRRIRVIQCTLAGLVVLPCLLLVPGYPRLAVLPALSGPVVMEASGGEAAEPQLADRNIAAADRVAPRSEEPTARESDADESIPDIGNQPRDDRAFVAVPLELREMPVDVPGSPSSDEPDDASGLNTDIPTSITVPPLSGDSRAATDAANVTSDAASPSHPGAPAQLEKELAGEQAAGAVALTFDYRLWIVAAYAFGVVLMAFWSMLGLVAVSRLLRSAKPAPEECRAVLRAEGGPKSDRVALLISTRVEQPCALLWRRTTIVLPQALVDQADSQALRWALVHEWSHVARRDLTTWTTSAIVRWFYFYQPLLWWLRGQLQLCQDYLADTAAARVGGTPEDYAEFLTTSSFTRPTIAAGLGIGGRISDLRRRVVMLVNPRGPVENTTPRRWNLAALPIAALVVLIAGGLAQQDDRLEAADRKPKETKQESPVAPVVVATEEAAAEPRSEPAGEPTPEPAIVDDESQLVPFDGAPPRNPQARSTESKHPTSWRVPEAVVEAKLAKDPVVVQLKQRISDLKAALAEQMAVSKNPAESSAGQKLQRVISKLDEQIDEYKAEQRPLIIERLIAQAKPRESLAESPRGKTESPEKGPRKIAPGDVLSIDVMDNLDSLDLPGLKLLIRPGTTATVDSKGKLSLGSTYGSFRVGGMSLEQAEAMLAGMLDGKVESSYLNPLQPKEKRNEVGRTLHLMQINVRLSFVGKDATPVTPDGTSRGPLRSVEPSLPALVETRPSQPKEQPAPAPVPSVPKTYASRTPVQHERIQPGDVLNIEVSPAEAMKLARPVSTVEADGSLALGVAFGRVNVRGKPLPEAETIIQNVIGQTYRDPKVQVTYAERAVDEDMFVETEKIHAHRLEQLKRLQQKGYVSRSAIDEERLKQMRELSELRGTDAGKIHQLERQVEQLIEQIATLQMALEKAQRPKARERGSESKSAVPGEPFVPSDTKPGDANKPTFSDAPE